MANPTPLSLMDFVKSAKSRIREVTPQELQRLLAQQPELLLVDVREPNEHQKAHIDKSLLVPRGVLEAAADPCFPGHVPELSAARDRPVVTYCASGGRSAMAADTLQQMGFSQVSSLDGGFERWTKEGLPVIGDASPS